MPLWTINLYLEIYPHGNLGAYAKWAKRSKDLQGYLALCRKNRGLHKMWTPSRQGYSAYLATLHNRQRFWSA